MLVFLLMLLPALVALFCVVQNTFFSYRSSTFGTSQTMLLLIAVYILADSLYTYPGVSSDILAYSRLAELVTAPCLVPLAWMYLYKVKLDRRFISLQYLWLVLPLFTLIIGVLLHILAGPDLIAGFIEDLYANGPSAAPKHRGDAVFIYYVFTVIIFRALVGIELLGAFGYMLWYMRKERMSPLDLHRFYAKGAHCTVLELQMYNFILPALIILAKTILSTSFLKGNAWVGLTLSGLITLCIISFAFTALFASRGRISLENMRQVMVYNYNSANRPAIVEFIQEDLLDEADEGGLRRLRDKISERLPNEPSEEGAPGGITEQLFATMAGTWDEESLLSRFQNLMIKNKIFLQPSISLAEIADKLHTNKTYVSKLVNNTYNMGFPELLNTLRIDYAQQYILSHRKAKQNEIAEACGFLSASTFNSIFKKVTGVTPKVWMSSVNK